MSGQPQSKRLRSMCDVALGDADDIMPMGPWGHTGIPDWEGPVPMDSQPRASAASSSTEHTAEATPAPTAGSKRMIKATSVRPPPSVADARFLKSALDAWVEIVSAMADAFEARAKMTALVSDQLEPFFGTKKPGTLAVHASAWRLFLRFADAEGLDPSKLDE